MMNYPRQLKMIRTTYDDLLSCMMPGEGYVAKMIFPELPADTRIHSMFHDPLYMNVNIIVMSSQFESVPDGVMIPEIQTRREVVKIQADPKPGAISDVWKS